MQGTVAPGFWFDRKGTLVPQHSVYYIVPNDPSKLDDLAAYLNSLESRRWLVAHCQRAAKGYLRMQSDKQFMGGYGTKGVDAYVSDESEPGTGTRQGPQNFRDIVPTTAPRQFCDPSPQKTSSFSASQ